MLCITYVSMLYITYVYICIYLIYNIDTRLCMCTHGVCMHTWCTLYVCVYIHTCLRMCTHTYMLTYVYTYIHTCISICMNTCMFRYMYVRWVDTPRHVCIHMLCLDTYVYICYT